MVTTALLTKHLSMNPEKLVQLQRESKRRYGYSEARIRAEEIYGVVKPGSRPEPNKKIDWSRVKQIAKTLN